MLTVLGPSPSIDITYQVDDYRLGEIHRPSTVARCAGGKALNMARAARRMGAEVTLTTVVGGASGDWIVTELEAEGVRTAAVSSPHETRTCVSVSSTATGTLTEIYEHAPTTDPEVWQALVERTGDLLGDRPGWLSTSGSMPRNLPTDALADVVRLGHRHGVRVAVDSSGPALKAALAEKPALVKVNRSEAAAELDVDPAGELGVMARSLAERTGGLVVLTDGAHGAVGFDGHALVRAELTQVHGTFPVGSGDSFLGGLLTGLDRGDALADALRLAMACGTANALVPGAGRFEAQEAEEMAARVTVTPAD